MVKSMSAGTKLFEELFLTGKLELELNHQSTMAERIRADTLGVCHSRVLYPRWCGHGGGGGKPTRDFEKA